MRLKAWPDPMVEAVESDLHALAADVVKGPEVTSAQHES